MIKAGLFGNINNNPMLDNREYEVGFSYGTTEVLINNIIATQKMRE